MKSAYLSAAIAITITGCTTAPALTTPSGKPEVFIKGHSQQEVVDALAASCASNGNIVESQTASTVICGQEPSLLMQGLFNTRGGSSTIKTQAVVLKQADGQRVTVTNMWVEAVNGFGGVSRNNMPIKGKLAADIQAGLERMAARLDENSFKQNATK